MRNSIAIVLLMIVIIGCKPTVPSKYIQPGDLEDILYDYHVSQAMAKEVTNGNDGNYDYKKNLYFLAVLKKHDVSEAVFDSSLVYYYSHADKLKEIYLRVAERLNDEAKVLGASVGDIGIYSQYSETGDTANIWKYETDMLLIPKPTVNRFDIHVKADTSFYKGDSFMFQFMSDFIYQSGSREAVVCMVAKYEGDSIIQTVSRVSASGLTQLRIPRYPEGTLKELNGFILLNSNEEDNDIRKLMFISQIQLIRFHHQKEQNDQKNSSENKTDSLPRTPNTSGRTPDTTSHRDIQRTGAPSLSSHGRAAIYGMDNQSIKPTRR